MNFSKISAFAALIASGVVGFAATPAMAATFASEVYDMSGNPLGDGNLGDRFDVDNALTPPDEKFYSMDLGESLIFGFGGKKFNSFKLWETTLVNRQDWQETVTVAVGNDLSGDFNVIVADNILNDEAMTDHIDVGGMYKFLKITDTTSITNPGGNAVNDGNGFDIDAIAVKTTPEPTSILGLLAMSGLGATVVRKRKQNLG
ncbi:PEP-CTERM sorting domain-containing protein [Dapis sp. BLCC M229]|uniref:PEP-CTERM sorting domain-containing protein n=1 Tax=Dapis sp. BLCC M229 TaxID=3400188 RepID=UPI003CF3DBD8